MKSKQEKIQHYDRMAAQRSHWRRRNRYYYDDLEQYLRFLIPANARVLEIGCGTGELLAALHPSHGVGIDFSPAMVEAARRNHPENDYPNLQFVVDDVEELQLAGPFDYVVMSDVIGELTDVWVAFRNLLKVSNDSTRFVITYFNHLWEPVLRLGERSGLKMPQDYQNWLSLKDIKGLLDLNGIEVVKQGYRQLIPRYIPVVTALVNRFVGKLPVLDRLGLVEFVVAKPVYPPPGVERAASVSVIVPCRNERDNIRDAVIRMPEMGAHTEVIFVDGNSNDGTVDAIEAAIAEFAGRKDIKLIHQLPPGTAEGREHGRMLTLGKGDAVRKGFAAANGEILMILDADLTVSPEDLPKFYHTIAERRGELINGTRLVYPMEEQAMRFLNKIANHVFGVLFSWLLEQRIKDTLCGTKVLRKTDYEKIAREREFFGDFDPFGDFDLLFGAAKQNLKIVEVPVRYKERVHGDIKIERFRHGILLLKMSVIAIRKLKFR